LLVALLGEAGLGGELRLHLLLDLRHLLLQRLDAGVGLGHQRVGLALAELDERLERLDLAGAGLDPLRRLIATIPPKRKEACLLVASLGRRVATTSTLFSNIR
jgi:hypothetical protein